MTEKPSVYDRLKLARQNPQFSLKPTPTLTVAVTPTCEQKAAVTLRPYQAVGAYHLLVQPRMVLGDCCGSGKCVTEDTLLRTDRGWLPIGALAPPQEVDEGFASFTQVPPAVLDGMNLTPPKRFYHGGLQACLTVTTAYGYRVTGTKAHPVLVWRDGSHQFVPLGELEPTTDYLCVDRTPVPFPPDPALPAPVQKHLQAPTHLDPDLASLLGFCVAEGHLNGTSLRLRVSSPFKRGVVARLMDRLFGWREPGYHPQEIRICRRGVVRFLEACGLDLTCNQDRVVPWSVLQGSQASVSAFLAAIFEGKASISPEGRIELRTSSRPLAQTLQVMLLGYGIVSSLREKTAIHASKYSLKIGGPSSRIFRDEIGFLSFEKQDYLRAKTNRGEHCNRDLVPGCEGRLPELVALLRERDPQWLNKNVVLRTRVQTIKTGKSHPSYAFLDRFLAECRAHGLQDTESYIELESRVEAHYFYDRIETVTPGTADVVDLEMPDPCHSFVGNGLVCHNTVQTVAALSYLWDRLEPTHKVIVVCPKSALYQWQSEVARFTAGVTVYVASGPNRKKAYEAFFSADPTKSKSLLLVGYASLARDWHQGAGSVKVNGKLTVTQGYLEGLVTKAVTAYPLSLVLDECFEYHTPVLLADGTKQLIGQIATNKLAVRVLSWDFSTGQVVQKNVIGWYRRPLHSKGSLLRVDFRFAGTVNVTKNHNFYRTNGEKVPAVKLKVGTKTAAYLCNTPSDVQAQVVYGGLLGDASVAGRKTLLWGIVFGHSSKQKEYLQFKKTVLQSLGVSEDTHHQTEYQTGEQQMVHFRLNGNAAITSKLCDAGIWSQDCKTITASFLDMVNPWGLAIWYGDDGSLSTFTRSDGSKRYNITLHTEGYHRFEVELLAGWLRWRWGVSALVKIRKNKRSACKPYYVLYLPHEAAQNFLNLLPGALPGVAYKFPGKKVIDPAILDLTPKASIVVDEVISVSTCLPPVNPKLKTQFVYDLEVEGTHNYFANGALVSNCTAVKNPQTKTHEVCKQLAGQAKRAYGLTATLLRNSLMDGYGIYKVILPDLFRNKTRFMEDYCVTRTMFLGRKQVPLIVGYKNLSVFRSTIDPYFLGRRKEDISKDLPVLTSRDVEVTLSSEEATKYDEALTGVLDLMSGERRDYTETVAMTSLLYCQQIANSLALIDADPTGCTLAVSSKEEALIDLLTEGLDGEKVIVYTRFEKGIERLRALLQKAGVKTTRITGKEKDHERQKNRLAFQEGDTSVIVITDAASEALNLQAAAAMVFFDSPWSWGHLVQLIGRMVRIGSPHRGVVVYHLLATLPGKKKKTIDHYVVDTLRRKKGLIDQVIGEAAVGALVFEGDMGVVHDLMGKIRDDSL